MKAIVVKLEVFEAEFAQTLKLLELANLKEGPHNRSGSDAQELLQRLHRVFHYEVVALQRRLESA